jgi:hypothetical protein
MFMKHHLRNFMNFMKLTFNFNFFKARARTSRFVWMEEIAEVKSSQTCS